MSSQVLQQKKSLEEQLEIALKTITEQTAQINSLQLQLAQILRLIKGFKSERFMGQVINEFQLSLFEENELIDQTLEKTPEPKNQKISYERESKKHPGRGDLPEGFPVEEVILEPQEDTEGLKKIGEQVTETLKYTAASLVKLRRIRPKYEKPNGEGVIIADLPSRPIDKCIVEACVLAYILVSKFIDHLPYYRQIQRFKREFGWEVSQSTVNNWMQACFTLLEPLYNQLKQKVLDSDYLQADETPMKVLESEKPGSCHQGYQWIYQDPLRKLVLFDYQKGRDKHGPMQLLADHQGYLQCDGYSVYDNIARLYPSIILVGCLTHARRKFHEALNFDKIKAEQVMAIIREMYAIERFIQKNHAGDFKTIKQKRNEQLKPLFDQWQLWMEENNAAILPKSALGKAITYSTNQWHKLIRVLDDGRLKLDNNLTENTVRPLALGRKNYLFAGNHKFAQYAAMMYSFTASCKANNVNPQQWLTETLEKLPGHSIQKLDELLPGALKPNAAN